MVAETCGPLGQLEIIYIRYSTFLFTFSQFYGMFFINLHLILLVSHPSDMCIQE